MCHAHIGFSSLVTLVLREMLVLRAFVPPICPIISNDNWVWELFIGELNRGKERREVRCAELCICRLSRTLTNAAGFLPGFSSFAQTDIRSQLLFTKKKTCQVNNLPDRAVPHDIVFHPPSQGHGKSCTIYISVLHLLYPWNSFCPTYRPTYL